MSEKITLVRELLDIQADVEDYEIKSRLSDLISAVCEREGAYDRGYSDGIETALETIKECFGKNV